jgi:hypothetical protein
MDDGRALAESLWGAEAVAAALACPVPAALDADLRAAIRERLSNDAELAAWGHGLDAPAFATLVRLLVGDTRRDLLRSPGKGGH